MQRPLTFTPSASQDDWFYDCLELTKTASAIELRRHLNSGCVRLRWSEADVGGDYPLYKATVVIHSTKYGADNPSVRRGQYVYVYEPDRIGPLVDARLCGAFSQFLNQPLPTDDVAEASISLKISGTMMMVSGVQTPDGRRHFDISTKNSSDASARDGRISYIDETAKMLLPNADLLDYLVDSQTTLILEMWNRRDSVHGYAPGIDGFLVTGATIGINLGSCDLPGVTNVNPDDLDELCHDYDIPMTPTWKVTGVSKCRDVFHRLRNRDSLSHACIVAALGVGQGVSMVEVLKMFGYRSEGLVIMIGGVKFKYKFPCYTLVTMILRSVVRDFNDGKPPALGRVISSMDAKLGVLCDTVAGRAHWRKVLLECFLLLWENTVPCRLGIGHHVDIFDHAVENDPRSGVEAEIEKLIGNRWICAEPFDIVVCDPSQGPTICAQLDRNGLVGSPLRGAPGTKKPIGPVDATLRSVPLPTLKVPTFIVLPPDGVEIELWKRKKIDAVSDGAVVVVGIPGLMEAIAASGCVTVNDDVIPPGVFELYAENDNLIHRVQAQLFASVDPDNIMVLMMGVPGAGKSHVAKAIAEIYTNFTGKTACIASADDYQSDDGFDASQLSACHRLCRFKVAEAVGTVLVIVDNTNITVADRDPYIAMATGRVLVVYVGSELRDFPADVKVLSYTSNNRATPVPVSVSVRMLQKRDIDLRDYGCDYTKWLTSRDTTARLDCVVVRTWPRRDVVYYDAEWGRNTNKMAIARDGTDIPHMTLLSAHNTPKGIETPVFETSPILVGPGMVVGPDGKRAWYDLYEWPEARAWVATVTAEAPSELFHVTRGFDETDIHTLKDRSTLSPHPGVDPRPVVTVVGIC